MRPTFGAAIIARLSFFIVLFGLVLVLRDAGALPAALLALFVVAYLSRRRWPGSGTTHGTAAFSTAAAARSAALTTGTGLHLGKLFDPAPPPAKLPALVNMLTAPLGRSADAVEELRVAFGAPRPQVRLHARSIGHSSVIASTRSGKGASILVPTLLTYPGPVLVFDPKPELFALVADARRAMGRDVRLFDPYGKVDPSGSETFNPLAIIDPGDPLAPDLARDFAVSLVVRTGEERETFFPNMSEIVLQTFILGVVWAGKKEECNLAFVADLIANPAAFAAALDAMKHSEAYDGVLKTLANQCSQMEGRERASVLSSCAQYLGFLNSPAVRVAIRECSFDPLWLKTGNTDLFLAFPAERVRSASGFCRFILSGLLRRLAEGPPDESMPVLVVLDESSLFGSLPVLEDAVTLLAGWGLKFIFVWQSLGQISECFPDGKAQTFLANMSVQVFGKTNDLETAKHVSERCGETTVLATSVQDGGSSSYSGGADPRQSSSQKSTSWSVTHNEAGRRLIRPEEVLDLPAECMIVFTDRTPPMLVRQVRYYEPEFAGPRSRSPLAVLGRFLLVMCLLLALPFALAALSQFVASLKTPAPTTPDPGRGQPGGWHAHRPPGGFNHGR